MKMQQDNDPIVLLVDDFWGTGSTAVKGIKTFLGLISDNKVKEKYLKEGRILFYTMFSFPEALFQFHGGHRVRFPHCKRSRFGWFAHLAGALTPAGFPVPDMPNLFAKLF